MPKTTKEIIIYSWKNQDFNIKENYPNITHVMDELDWIEEPLELWYSQYEVDEKDRKIVELEEETLESAKTIVSVMIEHDKKFEHLKKELKESIGRLAETEDYVVMEDLFRNHIKGFHDLEISHKYVEKTINKKIDAVFAKYEKGD